MMRSQLPAALIEELDALAAEMYADGTLYARDEDKDKGDAWTTMPPEPSADSLARVREVEAMMDDDPDLTLAAACYRVGVRHGLTADTVRHARARALAHRLIEPRPRRAKPLTVSPKQRAAMQRVMSKE